jgi:effector-binding domain-containing protein
MAYPVLEGLLKQLSDEIEMDGTVNPGYVITNLSGEDYQSDGQNKKVSAIRDLLYHVEESANDELTKRMEEARGKISDFYHRGYGAEYGLVYERRNRTLHGEAEAQADYGIPLTLISLLVWNELSEKP